MSDSEQHGMDFAQALDTLEWYDNSTLDLIDSCLRKTYWGKFYTLPSETTHGIAQPMGPGAGYGTCVHAALGKYYGLSKFGANKRQRIFAALQEFSRKHTEMFQDPDTLNEKHSLERGIDVLDQYFSHYDMEDNDYDVVECELAAQVRIEYTEGDPFEFAPFTFVAKGDLIVDRKNYGDRIIVEHKTTSGGVDQKLTDLRMSRQPTGYGYTFNQFNSDKPIVGIMGNVIGVYVRQTKTAKLFGRDFYPRSALDYAEWRLETIHKVRRWRRFLVDYNAIGGSAANEFDLLSLFSKSTGECMRYGKCGFYDLCYAGTKNLHPGQYAPNTWSPFKKED